MKKHLLWLPALTMLSALAPPARASLVTYQFTGTVSVYSPTSSDLPSSIQVGSTAVGTFSFDNSAPGFQFYWGAALQMSETVTIDNTYTFSLTTLGSGDEIDLFSGSFGFYKRGPDVPLSFAPGTNVSFLDAFGFGSTSDDLSQTTVLLEPGATIGISDAFSSLPYYYIGINVTSLAQVTQATVPEPGGLFLCAAGLLALGGYRRLRRGSRE